MLDEHYTSGRSRKSSNRDESVEGPRDYYSCWPNCRPRRTGGRPAARLHSSKSVTRGWGAQRHAFSFQAEREPTVSIFSNRLRIGDRYTDKEGDEWEIVSQPLTLRG